MSRVAYVNGRYLPHAQARVHVEDRGYQFADGVYEVILVAGGGLVDEEAHLDRLERSLRELAMRAPMSRAALKLVLRETIRRNRVRDAMVYLQINRGVAPRDHAFPVGVKPSVVCTARRVVLPQGMDDHPGVAVVTVPDIRWRRCDIKSVSLLPNVLAKQKAEEANAYEAWLVDAAGYVSEGSSTNAWIVDDSGQVVTRPVGNEILSGITRGAVIRLARGAGVEVSERRFTLSEAKEAREAFVTSTTCLVRPVTQIDDTVVANGHPGALTRRLLGLYLTYVRGSGAAA
ncbi:MAG: D-amino-acid transaminase [Alphaproteobacteria bacterium]